MLVNADIVSSLPFIFIYASSCSVFDQLYCLKRFTFYKVRLIKILKLKNFLSKTLHSKYKTIKFKVKCLI